MSNTVKFIQEAEESLIKIKNTESELNVALTNLESLEEQYQNAKSLAGDLKDRLASLNYDYEGFIDTKKPDNLSREQVNEMLDKRIQILMEVNLLEGFTKEVATPSPAPKKRRKRRTKAEIEADKAAAEQAANSELNQNQDVESEQRIEEKNSSQNEEANVPDKSSVTTEGVKVEVNDKEVTFEPEENSSDTDTTDKSDDVEGFDEFDPDEFLSSTNDEDDETPEENQNFSDEDSEDESDNSIEIPGFLAD